jgi:hypothetical protein
VRGSVRELKQELRAAGHAVRQAVSPMIVIGRGGGEAAGESAADPKTTLVRKAAELAAEVARLVSLGRASTEDIRVATTVIDSVRAQLQHILRG